MARSPVRSVLAPSSDALVTSSFSSFLFPQQMMNMSTSCPVQLGLMRLDLFNASQMRCIKATLTPWACQLLPHQGSHITTCHTHVGPPFDKSINMRDTLSDPPFGVNKRRNLPESADQEATSNKGISTRSKVQVAPGISTRNKKLVTLSWCHFVFACFRHTFQLPQRAWKSNTQPDRDRHILNLHELPKRRRPQRLGGFGLRPVDTSAPSRVLVAMPFVTSSVLAPSSKARSP